MGLRLRFFKGFKGFSFGGLGGLNGLGGLSIVCTWPVLLLTQEGHPTLNERSHIVDEGSKEVPSAGVFSD